MIEYKPKAVNIILHAIFTVLFVMVVILLLNNGQYLFTMICTVLAYYILSLLFKKRVTGIKINNELKAIEITYCRYGVLKHIEKYQFNNVSVTYKTETGPRGIKTKELRLYDSLQNILFKIIPNHSGWSKDDLEAIYKHLNVSC